MGITSRPDFLLFFSLWPNHPLLLMYAPRTSRPPHSHDAAAVMRPIQGCSGILRSGQVHVQHSGSEPTGNSDSEATPCSPEPFLILRAPQHALLHLYSTILRFLPNQEHSVFFRGQGDYRQPAYMCFRSIHVDAGAPIGIRTIMAETTKRSFGFASWRLQTKHAADLVCDSVIPHAQYMCTTNSRTDDACQSPFQVFPSYSALSHVVLYWSCRHEIKLIIYGWMTFLPTVAVEPFCASFYKIETPTAATEFSWEFALRWSCTGHPQVHRTGRLEL